MEKYLTFNTRLALVFSLWSLTLFRPCSLRVLRLSDLVFLRAYAQAWTEMVRSSAQAQWRCGGGKIRRSSCNSYTISSTPCFHYPHLLLLSGLQLWSLLWRSRLASCSLVLPTCKCFCLTSLLLSKSLTPFFFNTYCGTIHIKNLPF